jgi:molybdopterin converting factor small subunit
MARIHFSTPLRRFTGGVAEVELDAPTVQALITELDRRFPGIAAPLNEGTAVAIDGEIIAQATYEPIPEGADVHFVTAPVGG